jgi:hypothetical protein
LKQVLGSLNTQQLKEEEEFEEKFTESDFYNKTFLLTSHPLKTQAPKGSKRWSIKYNKFVGTFQTAVSQNFPKIVYATKLTFSKTNRTSLYTHLLHLVFCEEDPPPKSKNTKKEDQNRPIPTVNVLEVKFFKNNTFATVGGMCCVPFLGLC